MQGGGQIHQVDAGQGNIQAKEKGEPQSHSGGTFPAAAVTAPPGSLRFGHHHTPAGRPILPQLPRHIVGAAHLPVPVHQTGISGYMFNLHHG